MNAIELLEQQHRDIDELFSRIERAGGRAAKRRDFNELADLLAIHAAIEERHFYAAARESGTEDLLRTFVDDHLAIKRLLADLLRTSVEDERFDAQLKALREQMQRHVREEQRVLFPRARELLDEDLLEAIGQEMTATMTDLQQRKPRPRAEAALQTAAAPPRRGPLTELLGNLVGFVMAPLRTALGLLRAAAQARAPRRRREA